MKLRNIRKQTQPKENMVVVRVSDETKDWLHRKGYSPTRIFNEALKELKCPFVR